jgi:hypothetical protein
MTHPSVLSGSRRVESQLLQDPDYSNNRSTRALPLSDYSFAAIASAFIFR